MQKNKSNGFVTPDGGTGYFIEYIRWRNVWLDMILTSLWTLAATMPFGNLFDTYIFHIFGNKNSWVGYLSGARGMTTLIVSFPVGMLVDLWDRTIFCKVSSLICLLYAGVGLYAIWWDDTIGLFLYCILFRLGADISNAAAGAIFTDSLYKSERVSYFTLRATVLSLSLGIGPLISLMYFSFYNNSWDLNVLKNLIMTSLMILGPFQSIVLLLYKSVELETHAYEPIQSTTSTTVTSSSNPHISIETGHIEMTENNNTQKHISTNLASEIPMISLRQYSKKNIEGTYHISTKEQKPSNHDRSLNTRYKIIPFIILGCSVIRMFGAGMMVTYLPLFFKNDYQMKPNEVSLIYVFQALSISFFNQISNRFIRFLGRPATSFLYGAVATFFLVWMTSAKDTKTVIIVFLLRGGIQNAIRPIDQTLIMDYTSSKSRGKWIAATGFIQIVFSGSAVIGGYIADENDYRYIFHIASIFYTVSSIFYLIVFTLVKPEDLPRFANRHKQELTTKNS